MSTIKIKRLVFGGTAVIAVLVYLAFAAAVPDVNVKAVVNVDQLVDFENVATGANPRVGIVVRNIPQRFSADATVA